MSNAKKIIKELVKVIGKDFHEYDTIKDDDFNFVFAIKDDVITELGLDLIKLNLDTKQLEEVEDILSKLLNLRRLNLKYTKDNKIPEWLKEFKNLENLSLYQNNLKILPEWLKEFNNLMYLNLESNDLTMLPDWLLNLTKLNVFKIKNNFNLAWDQRNLDILKKLAVRNVQITAPRLFSFQITYNLPKEKIDIILELEKDNIEKEKLRQYVNPINMKIENGKVVEWRLFEYNINSLPENFGLFKDLRSLTITRTLLETLPKSFGELTKLEHLDLNSNKLHSLPDSFINLTAIKELDLSNNKFVEIPRELWPLNQLSVLNLSGNPFSPEELTISKKIPELILEFLRKEAAIVIFISHAVVDFDPYRIGDIVKYLEKQKEISQVYFCEDDLAGNIDEWMLNTVQKSQLILFIGTKKSVFNSADCSNELQLADKFSIPVIPVKGYDVEWSDLAEKNLSRELGLQFDKDNFDEFCDNLYKYICNFKREIDLMSSETRIQGITNIYERFRLMLDETIGDLSKKINNLADRIKDLENKLL